MEGVAGKKLIAELRVWQKYLTKKKGLPSAWWESEGLESEGNHKLGLRGS